MFQSRGKRRRAPFNGLESHSRRHRPHTGTLVEVPGNPTDRPLYDRVRVHDFVHARRYRQRSSVVDIFHVSNVSYLSRTIYYRTRVAWAQSVEEKDVCCLPS